MFNYNRLNIFFLSLIISSVIYVFLNYMYLNKINLYNNILNSYNNLISEMKNKKSNNKENNNDNDKEIKIIKEEQEEKLDKNSINNGDVKKEDLPGYIEKIEYNWGISIPKINLIAPIEEGTTSQIMNRSVGHFVDTSISNGNVALAAHNRGYPKNYFENIKLLRKGDYILYKLDDISKIYIVDIVTVIKDTDWRYLENTEDNRITLITCIENEPEYRRCIQGKEIKLEEERIE